MKEKVKLIITWGGRQEGDSGWEGTHVYLWPIHVDEWQKPSQYFKVVILQLKINTFGFMLMYGKTDKIF